MKNFYRLKFKRNIIIFSVFICLLSLTSLTINIIRIIQVGSITPVNLGIDISSLVLSIFIIAIVIYSFIRSGFYFKEDIMTFKLSIFSVNIPYEDTLLLRHDRKNKLLVLYYNYPIKTKEENIKFAIVSIDENKYDEVITSLKEKNPRLIYELFDKNKEEKN